MNKSFSILHISDLHRSSKENITNAELISALIGDRDRYIQEDPKIPIPDAIVVSGDIIQGVSLYTEDFEEKILEQYKVAEEFLNELVNRFLDGDRSRIIIIPGNHDVDWNTAFKAMKKIERENLPEDFANQLLSDNSLYRWDWKTLTPYRITDLELYSKRLELFWKFFKKFYEGVSGLLKVKVGNDANLFSLCDGRIGVAAFNSCDGNDCFAFHGKISKEAISRSHLEFKDFQNFDLQIAVWHHNFEGPPYRNDYMNVDFIKSMIGCGFRLGLYGHQHKVQVSPQQIWLPGNEKMAVISAGSLCAGSNDLPTGFTRQYNIIEIAEDFKKARVHVREMATSNLFSRGRLTDYGGKSFAELEWELPKNSVGGIVDNKIDRIRGAINEAEVAYKSGNPEAAIELLRSLDLPENSYERELLLEAAQTAKKWDVIIEKTNPPFTIMELTLRVDAFSRLHDYGSANKSLDLFANKMNMPEMVERELRQRLSTLNKIKNE